MNCELVASGMNEHDDVEILLEYLIDDEFVDELVEDEDALAASMPLSYDSYVFVGGLKLKFVGLFTLISCLAFVEKKIHFIIHNLKEFKIP